MDQARVKELFNLIYPDKDATVFTDRLLTLCKKYGVHDNKSARWSEKSNVLITYADNVMEQGQTPLSALHKFLNGVGKGAIDTVHLLPFYPWTSDDGFSVADYRNVKPEYGNWQDVSNLGQDFELMYDLVLNHCSVEHQWFKDYLNGVEYAKDYFHECDPSKDYSQVTRPRSLPLLTEFQSTQGLKHIWTTFSSDQVDLNFGNPEVFFEFADLFLLYMQKHGHIIRLDAPTYLWKELGTCCTSLPQTHAVVKLLRIVAQECFPQAIVLTETNVPHQENISYFGGDKNGRGDEAHMVYNFTLPPLLLYCIRKGDATHLKNWARTLSDIPQDCTYLNFTASHDGVGVRGLKGIISDNEIDQLCETVKSLGGRISTKRNSDGSDSPYEMNIVYIDALADTRDQPSEQLAARFLTSQRVAMALRGMPAIYFQSLVAGRNDYAGLAQTERNRTINRHKWELTELSRHLENPASRSICDQITHSLKVRAGCDAFDPLAPQNILDGPSEVFIVERKGKSQSVVCLSNLSSKEIQLPENYLGRCILSNRAFAKAPILKSYETIWLQKN